MSCNCLPFPCSLFSISAVVCVCVLVVVGGGGGGGAVDVVCIY